MKKEKKESKAFQVKEVKGDGQVRAVMATLNVVDSDGDVTVSGAFGEQEAPIQPAHNWNSVPLGKARVYEDGDDIKAYLNFNLDIQEGRDWYAALKFDFENGTAPLQQYSYGYAPEEFRFGEFKGDQVRFLEKVKVHEVSPVLLGAGINTRTLAVKSGLVKARSWEEHLEIVEILGSEVLDFYNRAKAGSAARGKEGRNLSPENRERLSRLVGKISDIKADTEKLLEETDSSEDDGKYADLLALHLKTQFELGHLLQQ